MDVSPYIKNGNVFERTISCAVAPSEVPGEQDYLFVMHFLFKALNSGVKPVTPNDMNKFEDGLNQYYQSQAYVEYFSLNKLTPGPNPSDPIDLEDTTSGDSEGKLTFYAVKVFGYPAFKKNTRMYMGLDSSSLIKDFTVHFNGTSDVVIFNGYFKIKSISYFFVYHTYDNVYHSALNKIRIINGLVKPKQVTDSLSITREVFVHTYDSTEEEYSRINATVHSSFQNVLRNTYLPKLATLARAQLVANYYTETSKLFYNAYSEKVIDTVMLSFEKYMKLKGQSCLTFTPIMFTRPVTNNLTMVQQFTGTIDGVLNYHKYELLKPSEKKYNETSGILSMVDVVRISYPQTGDKKSTFILDIRDERGISNQKNYTIESIQILSAYKANLTISPIGVVRDLDKWPYTNTGFVGKIQLANFNNLFDFAIYHANREIGIAIGSLFGKNP